MGIELFEEGAQLLYGTCSVREAIFHLDTQFRKGLPRVFGRKYGVVAEAFGAATRFGDVSVYTPFKEVLFSPDNQRNDGAEMRLAVRGTL